MPPAVPATGPAGHAGDRPAHSTRRFVRRVSVGLVLALLVVGIAGLVSIRFSTLRSDAVTDVVDPALGANAAAVQLATDARLAAIADEPTGLSAEQTGVSVAAQLSRLGPARSIDPELAPLLSTQATAAHGWTTSYAAFRAAPRDRAARAAEGASFGTFRGASAAVSAQLDRDRARLHAEAARLRDAARLAFGLLVLVGLVALALVGALASRFLVRPQRTLTDVVERLRAGESDARAPTDEGSAEVREIAVALNALADEVTDWRSAAAETDRLRNTSLDVARTVREELTTEAVLRAIPLVGEALLADRCWLRLTIGSAFGPVVREWAREGLDLVATDIPMAGDDPFGLAQRLWRRGEVLNLPYLTPDIDLGQRGLQGFVTTTGATSLLVVPVGAGERVLGLLGWAMTGGPRGWTADEVAWAQRVAADLGRALEHAQLYETQRGLVEQLRDLDRRRDDFLSTISHELRTPLTSILSSLDSVREGSRGPIAPELAQVLDAVGGDASRLGELIDDLLVLARIEDGSLAARQTPVDVAGIIEEAERAVRPLAEAGGVRLGRRRWPAGPHRPRRRPPPGAGRAQRAEQRGPAHPARRARRGGRPPRHPDRRAAADLR